MQVIAKSTGQFFQSLVATRNEEDDAKGEPFSTKTVDDGLVASFVVCENRFEVEKEVHGDTEVCEEADEEKGGKNILESALFERCFSELEKENLGTFRLPFVTNELQNVQLVHVQNMKCDQVDDCTEMRTKIEEHELQEADDEGCDILHDG